MKGENAPWGREIEFDRVACHEAGHCVMQVYYNRTILSVHVDAETDHGHWTEATDELIDFVSECTILFGGVAALIQTYPSETHAFHRIGAEDDWIKATDVIEGELRHAEVSGFGEALMTLGRLEKASELVHIPDNLRIEKDEVTAAAFTDWEHNGLRDRFKRLAEYLAWQNALAIMRLPGCVTALAGASGYIKRNGPDIEDGSALTEIIREGLGRPAPIVSTIAEV